MLEDPAGVRGQKPIICPKGDEEEQHPGASEDPGCQGSCSGLHGAAGGKPAQLEIRKGGKPPSFLGLWKSGARGILFLDVDNDLLAGVSFSGWWSRTNKSR